MRSRSGRFHLTDEDLRGTHPVGRGPRVVGATPRISEAYLEPVLKHTMRQFPFRILGFHTGNGSEFINKTVAGCSTNCSSNRPKAVLGKAATTAWWRPKTAPSSRGPQRRVIVAGVVHPGVPRPTLWVPRRSSSLRWFIRKHIRYGYIDAAHADRIDDFYREYLNPYLNYHRPCAQADAKIDDKGRKRVRYKRYQTPLETLSLLHDPSQYLRDGLSINALKRVAGALGDTGAARRMEQAKGKLFEKLRLTA